MSWTGGGQQSWGNGAKGQSKGQQSWGASNQQSWGAKIEQSWSNKPSTPWASKPSTPTTVAPKGASKGGAQQSAVVVKQLTDKLMKFTSDFNSMEKPATVAVESSKKSFRK
jgi:hypothetical protein